jgi:hypothetical protein
MAKPPKLWAVYVETYDFNEGHTTWKHKLGPFTAKKRAEDAVTELQRKNPVPNYWVKPYGWQPRRRAYV